MKFYSIIQVSLLSALLCLSPPLQAESSGAAAAQDRYDASAAIDLSQAALGSPLEDLLLTDRNGQPFSLSDLGGKPFIVSLIFTSCHHVCPAITRHLAKAVREARAALGEDSFTVLTIGFDTANDTPSAMSSFARAQKVNDPGWYFLSADADSMQQLTENLGFTYFPTPRGFDHVNQVTVVDREGVVYRQVYGADFELPALVEPLKQLVLNRPQAGTPFVASLADRIKLFCTVYDPKTGRYRFDLSLFVQIAIGGIFLLLLTGWLLREVFKARRKKTS